MKICKRFRGNVEVNKWDLSGLINKSRDIKSALTRFLSKKVCIYQGKWISLIQWDIYVVWYIEYREADVKREKSRIITNYYMRDYKRNSHPVTEIIRRTRVVTRCNVATTLGRSTPQLAAAAIAIKASCFRKSNGTRKFEDFEQQRLQPH